MDTTYTVSTSARHLLDHAIQNKPVYPGASYIEDVMNCAGAAHHVKFFDIDFKAPHFLAEESPGSVSYRLDTDSFTASSTEGTELCCGRYATSGETSAASIEMDDLHTRVVDERAMADIYSDFASCQNNYGGSYQSISTLYLTHTTYPVFARLRSGLSADIVFDGAVQVLAQAFDRGGRTFVLSRIGEVRMLGNLQDADGVIVENCRRGGNNLVGDLLVVRDLQHPVAVMKQVELTLLPLADDRELQTKNLTVCGTFTAEPLETPLKFWEHMLGFDADIEFAPYNQVVQQLLDPTSSLSRNPGDNIILLRFSDWLRFSGDENPLKGTLDGYDGLVHELPGGLPIAHLNAYESNYLFKEIFVDRAYLRHGIQLPDDAVVFDIGANVGLFSLFVKQQSPNARIYAFEPSPQALDCLKANMAAYAVDAFVLEAGAGKDESVADFTFYPNSSVFSSFTADAETDAAAIGAIVRNMVAQSGSYDDAVVDEFVEELMRGRTDSQTFSCQIQSVSSIIDQHNIQSIDLVKVDAEKAELDILDGIRTEHWDRIKQLVVEVHAQETSSLTTVLQMLQEKGFTCAVEEETLLQTSGLFNIYARRADADTSSSETALLEAHLEEYCNALTAADQRNTGPMLLTLCPEVTEHFPGGASEYLSLNTRLKSHVAQLNNVTLLDSDWSTRTYNIDNFYDLNRDMLGHIPYTAEGYLAIAAGISRALAARSRDPYKVVVLDCDNTLWRGVIGEDGIEGIDLPGPFLELQSFMKELIHDGILLCLCSKNSEHDVLAVFTARDDMVLSLDDVVGYRINWDPKSRNIQSLAQELNLGLSSFIFIDDNPVECAEVRASCPAVLTLQLPDEAKISSFLRNLWALDRVVVTQEDRQRSNQYFDSKKRDSSRASASSIGDFINSLNLKIDHEPIGQANVERASQMTMRTNQFNTTTLRLSEPEVFAVAEDNGKLSFLTRVSDRFGEYGLVGLVHASVDGKVCTVDGFLMSCRILGRGVEYSIVAEIARRAIQAGASRVEFGYNPSERNQPVLDFLNVLSRRVGTEAEPFCFSADALSGLTYVPDEEEFNKAEALNSKSISVSAEPPIEAEFLERIAHDFSDLEYALSLVSELGRKVRDDSLGPYLAPVTPTETTVAEVFRNALRLDHIGIKDNFFEAGGTSLVAVEVIAKLRHKLNKHLSAVALFEHTTVQALSSHLDGESTEKEGALDRAKSRGEARRAARRRSRK